jgi:PAS domain S-box-containing protein
MEAALKDRKPSPRKPPYPSRKTTDRAASRGVSRSGNPPKHARQAAGYSSPRESGKRPPPARRARPKPAAAHVDLNPFFDSPIDLLCIGDRNAIFRKLNPGWEAALGYPPAEMEGRDFLDFIHPGDQSAALEAFKEIDKRKSVQTLTNRVRAKDGTYRWLEWRYLLRKEKIYAAARDITDRKLAEDALRESRQMLETILDTIPVRVFWKDLNSMYVGCNRPFARDAGFSSPAELIGRDDYHMGWVEQADLYRSDDRMVMDTGRGKIGYEEPQTQADGKRTWLRTSKIPLRDLEGSIRGVLGTYEDITEQKAAEKALRENEERYHRITRTITDYIYHVRVQAGKALETYHGRRCLSVTGYSAEEFAQDADLWLRMVDPEDRTLVEDQARCILSGREAPVIEHRLWRKDGIRRWVRSTPVLLHDVKGNLISYDGLIQDITEQKEAELEIRAQHDLALALTATTDMQEGLWLCLKTAMRVTGMESGGIFLVEPRTGAMDLAVHHGLAADVLAMVGHLEAGSPEARWMMEGQPIYTDYQSLKEHMPSVPPPYEQLKTMVGIPIRHEQRIIGCLNLVSGTVKEIPTAVREILEITVAQIGNAIARLRSEAALRESEERYRQLFDLGSDAILFVENETGRILEANTAATVLYGYSREELLSRKNLDLSEEPEDTRRVTRTTATVPETIITIPLRLHRKKDGTVFPVEIIARFFIWQGKPVHISANRDISRRQKTEKELRESRRMLETVLNTIPVRVFWKDRESTYLGCNRAFAQDCGLESPEQVIGLDDYAFGRKDLVEVYRSDDRTVVETGQEKINYEELLVDPGGKAFWVSTSKIPLRNSDGQIRGVLGTYEDITERKQAEEQIRTLNAELEQRVVQRTAQLEAANKELEAFSFSVSHDLRAPLRAIDGFTRVLEEDYGKTLDEEGKRLCAILRRNTRHMYELIDDLLALSRLGRAEMDFLPVDLNSIVQSVFQELTTPESRARIDFLLEPLPKVVADPILLRQVWVNLVANAIKFSANRDRARIEVECASSPEEDAFSIRDNGAGFDMQFADQLFGVFQRLHNSSEFEGTGVGLAIVQRIVHRHGGRVWGEGSVGKGAVFHFTIPKNRKEADDPGTAP